MPDVTIRIMLTSAAMEALWAAAATDGLSHTDAINRAVALYADVTAARAGTCLQFPRPEHTGKPPRIIRIKQ